MKEAPPQYTYDEVPYTSDPVSWTHPHHLAAIAKLCGLEPPAVKGCSVLELGCGNGGNLISLAYSVPQASFSGIDLSEVQIAQGQSVISSLGLKNIKLAQGDVTRISADIGRFDYILCHGLFSWVPEDARRKVLELIRDRLTADGLAYISYNALPGWHLRRALRDMLLYHTKSAATPKEAAATARQFLGFASSSLDPRNGEFNAAFRNEVKFAESVPDWYLTHDFLAEENKPFYFHEFADLISRFGLQYLGDSQVSTMSALSFPAEVRERLRGFAGTAVEFEQYLDFLRNRHFRRTILCREGLKVKRQFEPGVIEQFYIASTLRSPTQPGGAGKEVKFTALNGGEIATTDESLQQALYILSEAWPETIAFPDLCGKIERLITTPASFSREELKRNLLTCFVGDMLLFYEEPLPLTSKVSDTPRGSRLARLVAERDKIVPTLNHSAVALIESERALFKLLDGTKTTGEIQKALQSKEDIRPALEKLAKNALLES